MKWQAKKIDPENLPQYDPATDTTTRRVVDLKKQVEQLKTEKLQEVNAV